MHLKSPEALEKLHKYNADLTLSQPELWPPIIKDKMKYACLGGNHFTVTLRAFKHGVAATVGGADFSIGDDKDLQNLVDNGHKYIVLSEDHSCT